MKPETKLKMYGHFLNPKIKKLIDCLEWSNNKEKGLAYIARQSGLTYGHNSKIFRKLKEAGFVRIKVNGRKHIPEVVE